MSEIRVECYAGYQGDETPRRFHIEGRTIEIIEILARWTEPNARIFRIRGDDGGVYVVRRNEREESWDVPEISG